MGIKMGDFRIHGMEAPRSNKDPAIEKRSNGGPAINSRPRDRMETPISNRTHAIESRWAGARGIKVGGSMIEVEGRNEVGPAGDRGAGGGIEVRATGGVEVWGIRSRGDQGGGTEIWRLRDCMIEWRP